MRSRLFHPPTLHAPRHDEGKKVTWLELFYDLVFAGLYLFDPDAVAGGDGSEAFARHAYYPENIREDERFVDVIHQLDDGRLMIDLTVFHDTMAHPTETETEGG